jgi:hypothetical protein
LSYQLFYAEHSAGDQVLDHQSTLHLDTVALRPVRIGTVTVRPQSPGDHRDVTSAIRLDPGFSTRHISSMFCPSSATWAATIKP